MSYERAEYHTCKDGNPCYGHKVNVEYIKEDHGHYGEILVRRTKCTKCRTFCDSENISPHKEFRSK